MSIDKINIELIVKMTWSLRGRKLDWFYAKCLYKQISINIFFDEKTLPQSTNDDVNISI